MIINIKSAGLLLRRVRGGNLSVTYQSITVILEIISEHTIKLCRVNFNKDGGWGEGDNKVMTKFY